MYTIKIGMGISLEKIGSLVKIRFIKWRPVKNRLEVDTTVGFEELDVFQQLFKWDT